MQTARRAAGLPPLEVRASPPLRQRAAGPALASNGDDGAALFEPDLDFVSVGIGDVRVREIGAELASAPDNTAGQLDGLDCVVDIVRRGQPKPEMGDPGRLARTSGVLFEDDNILAPRCLRLDDPLLTVDGIEAEYLRVEAKGTLCISYSEIEVSQTEGADHGVLRNGRPGRRAPALEMNPIPNQWVHAASRIKTLAQPMSIAVERERPTGRLVWRGYCGEHFYVQMAVARFGSEALSGRIDWDVQEWLPVLVVSACASDPRRVGVDLHATKFDVSVRDRMPAERSIGPRRMRFAGPPTHGATGLRARMQWKRVARLA